MPHPRPRRDSRHPLNPSRLLDDVRNAADWPTIPTWVLETLVLVLLLVILLLIGGDASTGT